MDPKRMLLPIRNQAPPVAYQSPPPPSSSTDASFPILAILIIGILTTAILLVSYYVFVIKCCLNWRHSDVISRLSNSRSRGRRRREQPSTVYATTTENHGLEESVIQAIPIIRFRKVGDSEERKRLFFHECAVCLNEFQEEERLRLLPNCSHAFHIDCIDTWLQTNDNCPICRSDITSPTPSDQFIAQRSLQDQNHGDSMVIEVRDDAIDLTPRSDEASVQSMATTQHSPSPKKVRKLQHVNSMGDECIDVRGKDDQFSIQPIRRSFSMDSSCDRQLYLAVQEMLQRKSRLQEASSGVGEGSSSARVRRSFFSFGHGRSSRNAILPISIDL